MFHPFSNNLFLLQPWSRIRILNRIPSNPHGLLPNIFNIHKHSFAVSTSHYHIFIHSNLPIIDIVSIICCSLSFVLKSYAHWLCIIGFILNTFTSVVWTQLFVNIFQKQRILFTNLNSFIIFSVTMFIYFLIKAITIHLQFIYYVYLC